MGESRNVPISRLVLTNPCLSQDKIERLKTYHPEEIMSMRPPITVTEYRGTFFVKDGNNRVEALKQLGIRSVEVNHDGIEAEDPMPSLSRMRRFSFR